jgi:hypothetical protein
LGLHGFESAPRAAARGYGDGERRGNVRLNRTS